MFKRTIKANISLLSEMPLMVSLWRGGRVTCLPSLSLCQIDLLFLLTINNQPEVTRRRSNPSLPFYYFTFFLNNIREQFLTLPFQKKRREEKCNMAI